MSVNIETCGTDAAARDVRCSFADRNAIEHERHVNSPLVSVYSICMDGSTAKAMVVCVAGYTKCMRSVELSV